MLTKPVGDLSVPSNLDNKARKVLGMILSLSTWPILRSYSYGSNEPSLAKFRIEFVDLRTVRCIHLLQTPSNHLVLHILPWDDISISTWPIPRSYSCAFK